MKIMKLVSPFFSTYLLVILWLTAGCTAKGISQNEILNASFDLTQCKWVIDSIAVFDLVTSDAEMQSADGARISNLFLKDLYEAKDEINYMEFRNNRRAYFSFVNSVDQDKFNFSYIQFDEQISFSLTDPSSHQVLNFSVDYYFSPNEIFPQLLINDSNYLFFYLSCGNGRVPD
jgi:hypothetical protein